MRETITIELDGHLEDNFSSILERIYNNSDKVIKLKPSLIHSLDSPENTILDDFCNMVDSNGASLNGLELLLESTNICTSKLNQWNSWCLEKGIKSLSYQYASISNCPQNLIQDYSEITSAYLPLINPNYPNEEIKQKYVNFVQTQMPKLDYVMVTMLGKYTYELNDFDIIYQLTKIPKIKNIDLIGCKVSQSTLNDIRGFLDANYDESLPKIQFITESSEPNLVVSDYSTSAVGIACSI